MSCWRAFRRLSVVIIWYMLTSLSPQSCPVLSSLSPPSSLPPHRRLLQGGKGVRAVVLAPTRELATQIGREFERLSQGKKFKMAVLTKV